MKHLSYGRAPAQRRWSLILALCWLLANGVSFAWEPQAAAPEAPSVWGVIVGVEQYAKLPVPPRPTASRDASRLYDRLVAKEGVGASVDRVRLLLDHPDPGRGGVAATADQFRRTLKNVAQFARPDDVFLLAIEADGLPERDEFRWLFADAEAEQFAKTTLLTSELRRLLDEIPCHCALLLVDVSIAPAAKALALEPALAHANWPAAFKGLVGPGRHVLAASDGLTLPPADRQQGEGLFWSAVAEGLGGAADREGGEPDSWVTARELCAYVQATVPPRAQALGLAGGKPEVFTQNRLASVPLENQVADAPIARNRSQQAAVERVQQQLAERSRAGMIDRDVTADGARLLARMPPLAAERRLRTAYEQYLRGAADLTALLALRQEVLAERRLPPPEASEFARQVLVAFDLVEKYYVLPNYGSRTVAAGLRGLFRAADEPVPAALEGSLRAIEQLDSTALENLLLQVRFQLGRRDDLAGQKAIDECLWSMMQPLDIHSHYLSGPLLQEFKKQNEGHFAGVGVLVRLDRVTNSIVVTTPLANSPALRAGIRADDRIVAINGTNVERIDLDQALEAMTGRKGETISLIIERPGVARRLRFDLVCEEIKVETVVGLRRRPDRSWDYWLDAAARLGYVRLTSFARDTSADLGRLLRQFERDGLRGLVLDLRFNGGGDLPAAVEVADLFVEDGTIVRVRARTADRKVWRGNRIGTYRGFPLAVLVNRLSASGSEIVAAAIADHRRGMIVGERTYGKGSIQYVLEITGAPGALKLTTAWFDRPNGQCLHRMPGAKESDEWGVRPTPGFEVPLYWEEVDQLQHQLKARENLGLAPPDPAAREPDDRALERARQWLFRESGPGAR